MLERTRDYRNMSHEDLGDYHRRFITCTAYLIRQNCFSDQERNASYLRGFPQPVQSRILHRLSIKKPDVLPNDGYEFADIHEVALFILNASVHDELDDTPTIVPKQEHLEQGSVGELIQAMSNLTRVFTANVQGCQGPPPPQPPRFPCPANAQTTPGGVVQNAPWWNPMNPVQYTQPCVFCSETDHLIRECNVAAEYLR